MQNIFITDYSGFIFYRNSSIYENLDLPTSNVQPNKKQTIRLKELSLYQLPYI